MTRNTVRRVEVATPIYDNDLRRRILEMFSVMLKDNVKARVQLSDGSYVKKEVFGTKLDSQAFFYKKAYQNATAVEVKPLRILKKKTLFSKLRELFNNKAK